MVITHSNIISNSKTVIWSGPIGYFEKKPYDKGTNKLVLSSQTGSFVQNSQTSSLLVRNSQTGSFVVNSQTGSFVVNSQTSSLLVRNSQNGSFVQNSQTSSFLVRN